MRRGHDLFLTGSFLIAIFSVPISQASLELYRRQRPQAIDGLLHAPTEANLRAYERALEDNSWIAEAVRRPMRQAHIFLLRQLGAKAVVGEAGWLFYAPDVDYLVNSHRLDAAAEVGPEAAARVIVAFRDQLRERGIHLLVVPVPGKASVYPNMVTRRAAGRVFRSPTRALLDDLRGRGVEVVDLFDTFNKLGRQDAELAAMPIYLKHDTHWTGRGAMIAAAAIARRIRQLNWIEPGAVIYQRRPTTIQRPGDILRMVELPGLGRRYPAQRVTCYQVVRAEDGALYEDRPGSEVLLLGDSFSRIYQTDDPKSAGLIAHLARELKMPLESIVNDGGASTLVRQQLSRQAAVLRGKRLVIWQFVERDIQFGAEGWQAVPLPASGRDAVKQPGSR